jgi:hypothetical protein
MTTETTKQKKEQRIYPLLFLFGLKELMRPTSPTEDNILAAGVKAEPSASVGHDLQGHGPFKIAVSGGRDGE